MDHQEGLQYALLCVQSVYYFYYLWKQGELIYKELFQDSLLGKSSDMRLHYGRPVVEYRLVVLSWSRPLLSLTLRSVL